MMQWPNKKLPYYKYMFNIKSLLQQPQAKIICDVVILVSDVFSYKMSEKEDFYTSILGPLLTTPRKTTCWFIRLSKIIL